MGFRIDWPTISGRYGSSEEQLLPYLFCLPDAGRDLLLAVCHMLEWRATYRIETYDYDDYDQLQTVVAAVTAGLTEKVALSELTELLNMDVNVNVNNNQNVTSAGGCGCGGGGTVNVNINTENPIDYTPPASLPPVTNPEEPIPEDLEFDDWDEFDANACAVANFAASRPSALLRQLDSALKQQLQEITLLGLASTVFGGWVGAAAGGMTAINIIGIMDGFLDLGDLESIIQPAIEAYEEELMPDLVCLIYESRHDWEAGAGLSAIAAVNSWIDGKGYSPAFSYLFDRLASTTFGQVTTRALQGLFFTPALVNAVDCSNCSQADYALDFGTLDDGAFPDFEPDGTGRTTEGERAIGMAPNATFTTVELTSRDAAFIDVIDGRAVDRIELLLSRWTDPATPSATATLFVDLRDSLDNVLEFQAFVSPLDYAALPLLTAPAKDQGDAGREWRLAQFGGATVPDRIVIVCQNTNGGTAQIQVGAIRIWWS